MKYPTISLARCSEIARQLTGGLSPVIDANVEWVGAGEEVGLAGIRKCAQELAADLATWTDPDRDRFEGLACEKLYAALQGFPTEALDDRGLWRYLALKYFWKFVSWREEEPFAAGTFLKYVDAVSSTESVLPRMYLRAGALGGVGHSDLAGGIPHSTDFWRSHVLRVRIGAAPTMTRAFATLQAGFRLPTNRLREVARHLNRTCTNVVPQLQDEEDAARILAGMWPRGEHA